MEKGLKKMSTERSRKIMVTILSKVSSLDNLEMEGGDR